MRKTKNLTTTLKALLLIFALSFLCTVQSNAQSRSYTPTNQQEVAWNPDFTNWGFFNWLKTIVTLDMSRSAVKPGPQVKPQSNNTTEEKRFNNNGSYIIVTPDMTVRDPDHK